MKAKPLASSKRRPACGSSTTTRMMADPQATRRLLQDNSFAFTECDLLVVEIDAATQLPDLMAAFLEAELNIHYMYCFIPHPQGKSILGVNMEDLEVGEKVLAQHGFRVLRQADISR